MKRRKVIKYGIKSAAVTLMNNLIPQTSQAQLPQKSFKKYKDGKIVVVGAGAFGGWTALHLLRKGYKVTLIDQFGPGNNQSSSGGETRIIRALYGQSANLF